MSEDSLSDDNQLIESLRTIEGEKTTIVTNPIQFFRKKLNEINWRDVGVSLLIFSFLFSLSILVRLLSAFYFRKFLYIDYINIVWNREVQLTPNNVPLMGFTDFPNYYLEWTRAWFEEGWRPYRTWIEGEPWNILNLYSYPPLFSYVVLASWNAICFWCFTNCVC